MLALVVEQEQVVEQERVLEQVQVPRKVPKKHKKTWSMPTMRM